jgi:hypothetical protein
MKAIYEFGDFRVDPAEQRLEQGGRPVALPPKVFETLLIFLQSEGRLIDKNEFMGQLWPCLRLSSPDSYPHAIVAIAVACSCYFCRSNRVLTAVAHPEEAIGVPFGSKNWTEAAVVTNSSGVFISISCVIV